MAHEVLTRQELMDSADAIVAAAQEFRAIATHLMERLARRLGSKSPDYSSDPRYWDRYRQSGLLDAEWEYFFHGFECDFSNRNTGQVLTVCLGFPDGFGILDPYFFARFVASTPEHGQVAALFRDPFQDSSRALEILEKERRLYRVFTSSLVNRSGLIAF